MKPGAGELRERVTIQSKTPAADTQGGRGQTPTTLDTVWAAVQPLSGVERLQAQSIGSQVSWRITIRYRGDVTPQMKVLWTPYSGVAKTFDIHSVTLRDGLPHFIDLDCGEVI